MTEFGYFLSCEEYAPRELIEQARLAQEAGFDRLWISDHFHPWTSVQGESAFVWSMIGALSQVCDLPITTAVTCPTVRTHPAIIAQAAATSAVLVGEGKFCLGLGSGEALNEHILGDKWPPAGPMATDLAARIGDSYATANADPDMLERFRSNAKKGAPAQVGFKVAWAETEEEGVDLAYKIWPKSGLPRARCRRCSAPLNTSNRRRPW